MKKKLLALSVTLLAFNFGWAQTFSYSFKGQTLTYQVLDKESKTCSVESNTETSGILEIPEVAIFENTEYAVTAISDYAFQNCKSLTSVILPPTMTSVNTTAFDKCSGLLKNAYPSTISNPFPSNRTVTKNIEYNPKDLTIVDGIYYNKDITSVLFVSIDFSGEYVVPKSVVDICDYAFDYCSSMTAIKDLKSIQSVGERAFYNCSGLTSIEFSDALQVVGNSAFSGCSGLITLELGNSLRVIGESAFTMCENAEVDLDLSLIEKIGAKAFWGCNGVKSVIIGNLIDSISSDAFHACRNMSNLVIGNSVKHIGDEAFSMCYGLKSIELNNSVESIGYLTFGSCKGLSKLVLDKTVKTIGKQAFYNCTGLESLVIGASVESIGDMAFIDCNALTSVVCKSTTPIEKSEDSQVFSNPVYENASLYVPEDALDAYKSTSPWSLFSNMVVGDPNKIESIKDQSNVLDLSKPYIIYDLNGSKVSFTDQSIQSMGKRIYIITQDGKSKKFISK